MKMDETIERVEIFRVPNPSLQPTVVRITTSEGTIGLGDCGVSYGVGSVTMPHLIGELAEAFVVGRKL